MLIDFCSMDYEEVMYMQAGDLVDAELFGGNSEKRIIVEICGKTVYVATQEEIERANKEGREAECVGFNREFIHSVSGLGL